MTHTNTTLQHYGIKGMRWGVRRTDAQLGRVRRQKTSNDVNVKKASSSSSTSTKKRKITDEMSDDELIRRIKRLQMEKQYAQLTAKEVSPGRKFVKDVLLNAGKQVATQYTAKFMSWGIDTAVNKLTGVKNASDKDNAANNNNK
jgi:hypothetical protein